jgi:hypothetical protein
MSKFPGPLIVAAASIALSPLLQAGASGARVQYVGGTGTSFIAKSEYVVQLGGDEDLVFESKGANLHVPYANVNVLEYGQKAERRIAEAIVISPLMLLSKRRTYFLTIGYTDSEGHQQAAVFRVASGDIRILLVSLEAKTGRKVEYQDDEARRGGKG